MAGIQEEREHQPNKTGCTRRTSPTLRGKVQRNRRYCPRAGGEGRRRISHTFSDITLFFGHYRLHTAEQHRFPGVKRARAVKKVVHFTVHHFFLLRVLPYFVRQTRCLFSRQRTFPLRTTEKCHSPTDWFQRTTFCRKPSEVSRRKTPCRSAKSSCTSEPVATKLRKVLPAAEYKRTRAPGCTPRNTKVEPTHCK